MPDTLTLALPIGGETGPISHGTVTYSPFREDHNDPASRWLVTVPTEVAAHLIGKGGFIVVDHQLAPAEERAPISMIRMFHPDGGVADAYPREDGYHLVPNGPAVTAMRDHGFRVAGEKGDPHLGPHEVAHDEAEHHTVPAEEHLAAMEEIERLKAVVAGLEERVREHERGGQQLRERHEIALTEIEGLKGKLDDAEKALAAKSAKAPRAAEKAAE